VERTRNAGGEIVSLLKNASAFYAPAESVATMLANIVHDKRELLSVSVFLQGEYGIAGIFLAVPVRLGRSGAEELVQITLDAAERDALQRSAEQVRQNIKELETLNLY